MNAADKRKKMIAKVKIAQAQLGLDDAVYRALLMRVTSRNSAAKLSEMQLSAVLAELGRLGFAPTRGNTGRMPLHLPDNKAMMGKLSALLAVSGKSWAYADGMAQRMFDRDKVSYLKGDELRRLIAALNIHIRKAQAAAAAEMGA